MSTVKDLLRARKARDTLTLAVTPEAEAALDAAGDDQRDEVLARHAADLATFELHGLDPPTFHLLLALHPATATQRAEVAARADPGAQELEFNPDTFPPALLAACLTDPIWTEQEVAELVWDDNRGLSVGNRALLFGTAWRLCKTMDVPAGDESTIMDLARLYRVPRSILLGRPMPAPGEPMWLPEDLQAAADHERRLTIERNRRCQSCGSLPDDWVDPETGKRWVQPRWMAKVIRCEGCRETANARQMADLGDGETIQLVGWQPPVETPPQPEDASPPADRTG